MERSVSGAKHTLNYKHSFSYYNLSENMVVLYSILTWYLGIIGSFHKIILDEDLLNHFFIGYSNVLRIQAHN